MSGPPRWSTCSSPPPANLAAYDAAVKATDTDKPTFLAAMDSPGTKSSETADEAKAIDDFIAGLSQMQALRAAVTNRALTPLQALGGYSAGIQNELKLFLAEADSLTNATAADQALGLIATVSAREALSQEYALLSGVLAGHRMTQADRAAFAEMVATRQGDMVDADSLLDPANLAIFNGQVNNAEQTQLAEIEGAVSAGTPSPGCRSRWSSGQGWPASCSTSTSPAASTSRTPSSRATTRSAAPPRPGSRSPAASAWPGYCSPSR